MTEVLNKTEIDRLLKKHQSSWQFQEGALMKTFCFHDFLEAISFVQTVAGISQKQNHHPEININYSVVVLKLFTNDSNGITIKDFLLAQEIDTL